MLSRQGIVFRADGNRLIGLGHISRCLALAELLSDNFEIIFALQQPDEYITRQLDTVADRVITLPVSQNDDSLNNELVSILTGKEIVVLDGYKFTTDYERIVKANAACVVTIDDVPGRHFLADVVINFCGAVSVGDYKKEFYTQLCLGSKYLFLRSPFLRKKVGKEGIEKGMLINMGGSDSENLTLEVLKKVMSSNFEGNVTVVIGHSFPHRKALDEFQISYPSISIQQGLSAREMFNLMSRCTVAILPPSTVALEFLSTGGKLFLKKTAENQACLYKYLVGKFALDYSQFGIDSNLQNPLDKPPISSESLDAVKSIFNGLSLRSQILLRPAFQADANLCFRWATDADTRKYSYSKSEITLENHVVWFDAKLSDPNCIYYIAEIDGRAVGQVRFDQSLEETGSYMISYLVDKHWRGKGLGSALLITSVQLLVRTKRVDNIIGYVQNVNVPSIKAFERAGFAKTDTVKYPDSCKFELSF